MTVLSFRAPNEQSRALLHFAAKQAGQSVSSYLSVNFLDWILNYEVDRAAVTIKDFSDLAAGRLKALDQGDGFTAEQVAQILNDLTQTYTDQRLPTFNSHLKRCSKLGIEMFTNDYVDDVSGAGAAESLVINTALVKIYDRLRTAGIIDDQTWAEKTAFYNLALDDYQKQKHQ